MSGSAKPKSFYETLTDAVNDVNEHGYDSEDRLRYWIEMIQAAALRSLVPEAQLEEALRRVLRSTYDRLVEREGILKVHEGIGKFTLLQVKPKLRAELDRSVLANAGLIKLNREAAVQKTVQRFAGWMSSVPPGGTKATDNVEVKTNIRKALAQLPFEERRVVIDQGHKFVSTLNSILATDGGAIAGKWHSQFRQAGYHYRPDHKDRDGQVYTIRNSWAHEQGLINKCDGFTDEMTKPGEEVFCRCSYRYVYTLRGLPERAWTARGRATLAARNAKKEAA